MIESNPVGRASNAVAQRLEACGMRPQDSAILVSSLQQALPEQAGVSEQTLSELAIAVVQIQATREYCGQQQGILEGIKDECAEMRQELNSAGVGDYEQRRDLWTSTRDIMLVGAAIFFYSFSFFKR